MPKLKPIPQLQQGIVSTVFNDFLAALESKPDVDKQVIERLRVALLEDQGA
jgi:hypothetical protein